MSLIIEEYYKKNKIMPALLTMKIESLAKHEDIQREFEDWIQSGEYSETGIEVKGYTAKSLAEKSKYLKGEGAFMMLIKLREKPDEALKTIDEGLKIK